MPFKNTGVCSHFVEVLNEGLGIVFCFLEAATARSTAGGGRSAEAKAGTGKTKEQDNNVSKRLKPELLKNRRDICR